MLWAIIFCIFFLLALFTAPGQYLFKAMSEGGSKNAYSYFVLFVRWIVKAHFVVIKNLVMPRKTINVSLEREDRVNHRE